MACFYERNDWIFPKLFLNDLEIITITQPVCAQEVSVRTSKVCAGFGVAL